MKWVKANNGNVLHLPDDQAEIAVAGGHQAFDTEKAAQAAKVVAPQADESPADDADDAEK